MLPKTKFDYALKLAQTIGFRLAFSAFAVRVIFRGNRV